MEAAEYAIMRAAEDHHWWYAGVHDLILRRVCAEAKRLQRPLAMLDAGCGTGRLCQLLQPYGEAAGCDIHPLAVAGSGQRGLERVWQADLMQDDLGTERFDVITSIDVLYHRAITNERAVLANLRRALRPGGCLLVQTAAFEALRGGHDVAVHTRRRYRLEEVTKLLELAKLRVEFVSYRLCALYLPALIWRACKHGRDDRPATSDVPTTGASWANAWLTRCVKLENRLLQAGMTLPVGTSVFAVARK